MGAKQQFCTGAIPYKRRVQIKKSCQIFSVKAHSFLKGCQLQSSWSADALVAEAMGAGLLF